MDFDCQKKGGRMFACSYSCTTSMWNVGKKFVLVPVFLIFLFFYFSTSTEV